MSYNYGSSNYSHKEEQRGFQRENRGGGYKQEYRSQKFGGYQSGQQHKLNDSKFGGTNQFNKFGGQNQFNKGGQIKQKQVQDQDLPGIDFSRVQLKSFQKNFQPSQNPMSREELNQLFNERNIFIKSDPLKVPRPFKTFKECQIPEYILNELYRLKFESPTLIQQACWPILLSGHDLIGIAQTGSGKTLAFLLPSIIHLNAQSPVIPGDGPICLVLAPTRELAVQIQEQCDRFGGSTGVRSICAYGGADKRPQENALRQGIDVLVATPGRLTDFLITRKTDMKRVTYLVLDEADRMLDMGFEPQIRKILNQIRPDRQTMMFSATWPKEVQKLAYDFLTDPVHIQIGDYQITSNLNIEQRIEIMPERVKSQRLSYILKEIGDKKVIIFAKTKKGTEKLYRDLRAQYYQVRSIHGDKTQSDRDYVMQEFKNGKVSILVATDVAARGLDVKDIDYVINFDFPIQISDYIHRIGRTGRAGAKGIAITFFSEEDERLTQDLVGVLSDAKIDVPKPLQDLLKTTGRYYDKSIFQLFKSNQNKHC